MPPEQLPTSFGSAYRLDREIGSGGMATVYLAHDVKHDRRVAIKVLHAELAAMLGAERFLREIKLTANLQHSHILGLIDSGVFGQEAGALEGRPFYVMPFVEGDSLRQRLDREQQLPVDEAVRIATEVASALDYAHRSGVVHRDIKPENILLRDGSALVADFGIALAVQSAGGQRMTQTGLSLGTPQYMSPEQAMGERAITARSDIYALGAVTYEMLVGEPPFTGPTVQAVVARLMAEAPRGLSVQRRSVPSNVDAAVLRALEKVPADRFSTAKEFGDALAGRDVAPAGSRRTAAAAVTRRSALPWALASLAMAVAVLGWVLPHRATDTPTVAIRASIALGDSSSASPYTIEPLILPGDSLMIVAGTDSANASISLLRLTTGERAAIRGTEGARSVAASPNGRSIAFAAHGQLWRLDLPNGTPVALTRARIATFVAWLDNGRIALGEDYGNVISLIPENGGEKDTLRVTPRSVSAQGLAMRSFPGGRLLIGTMIVDPAARKSVYLTTGDPAAVLDSASARVRVTGRLAQWLPSGFLAWLSSDRRLMIAPLDPRTLRFTGPAVTVSDSVETYTMGDGGLLAFVRAPDRLSGRLVIADRTGRRDTLPYPPTSYRTMDASPDGKRIAVTVDVGDHRELRLLDVAHAATTVWPAPPTQNMHEPRWSPDGSRIAVLATEARKEPYLLLLHADDATRVDTVCQCVFNPHAWSPDGREIAGTVNRNMLTVLARVGAQAHSSMRDAAAFDGPAWYQSFSPDGRWYTFSGTAGTYLVENRAGAVPTRIGSGGDAAWSPDGRHIAYITDVLPERWVMDIPVTPGARPAFGPPVRLFAAPALVDVAGQDIHFMPDGRILFIESSPVRPVVSMDVVTDWRAEYARKRPDGK